MSASPPTPRSSRRLNVFATADPSLARLLWQDGDTHVEGVATLPALALAHLGLEQSLPLDNPEGLADLATRYADRLVTALATGIGTELELSEAQVEVSGGPSLHSLAWEVLRLPSLSGRSGAEVVRVPPGVAPRERAAAREARLNWIGTRPFGDQDVSRYRILAPILMYLLAPDSAVVAGALRTNAHLEELDALIADVEERSAAIFHLDAHGISSVVPGHHAPLDEMFSFIVPSREGLVVVHDRAMVDALAEYRYTMFSTNACFGAQQRGVSELPLPARLVQGGLQVAIAAREPLGVEPAAHFFAALYGGLCAGSSISGSLRNAFAQLQTWAGTAATDRSRDVLARVFMQPMVWATGADALEEQFARKRPRDPELSGDARYTLGLMEIGGSLGSLGAAVEDQVHADPARPIAVRPTVGAAWQMEGVAEAVRALSAVIGRRPTTGSVANEVAQLEVRPASPTERWSLAHGAFVGSEVLLSLLAAVVPEDLDYINALSESSGGDASIALVRALAWGARTDFTLPRAASELVEDRLTRLRAGIAAPAEPRAHKAHNELLAAMAVYPLALPAVTLAGVEFQGAPVPPVPPLEENVLQAYVDGRTGEIAIDRDQVVALPHRRLQIAARAAAPPAGVALLRAFQQANGPRLEPRAGPWTNIGQAIALSWLAAAIGSRQGGWSDRPALVQAFTCVSEHDFSSALLLFIRIKEGLPGWPTLRAEVASDFEDLERALRSAARKDDSEPAACASRGQRALSALHAGEIDQVLELLEGRESGAFEERMTLGYALARRARTREAWRLLLPDIRTMGELSHFELCQLLHLLGHMAELDGKPQLAIRYMLEERTLDPPRADVRLHNRTHLLRLLAAHAPDRRDLRRSLAAEAVGIAVLASDDPELSFALQSWAEIVLERDEEEEFDQILAILEAFGVASDTRAVAFMRAIRTGDPASQLACVRPLTDGEDWVAREACLRLGMLNSIDPADQERWLRRAAELGSGRAGASLLDRFWVTERIDEFEDLASSFWRTGTPVQLLARAAVAEYRGQPQAAIEALSAVLDHQGLILTLQLRAPTPWGRAISDATDAEARGAVWTKHLTGLYAYVGEAPEAEPTADPVHSLRRLREFADHTDPGDFDGEASLFHFLSERLWDRGELEAAAQARGIGCRLRELSGDQARLAEDLSWLATLEKLCNRTTSAERLFQQAIELATGRLSGHELGSIYGRYGNLLHAERQFKAAVVMQWRGLRVRTGDDPDMPVTRGTLEQLVKTPVPDDPRLAMEYFLFVANLANCLFDDDRENDAAFLIEHVTEQCASLAAEPEAAEARNAPEAARMISLVRGRLTKLET